MPGGVVASQAMADQADQAEIQVPGMRSEADSEDQLEVPALLHWE